MIPKAKMKMSIGLVPVKKTAKMKNTKPTPSAIQVTVLVTFLSSFCNGLNSGPRLWVKPAMLPNSVSMSVANTTAVPDPLVTAVPAKTKLDSVPTDGSEFF